MKSPIVKSNHQIIMMPSVLLLLSALVVVLAARLGQSSYLTIQDYNNAHQQQSQQLQAHLQQQHQHQQQQQQQLGAEATLVPSIIPFSFNQYVQEKERVMVMCTTSSGEIPDSFTWLKDDQVIGPQVAQARRITIKLDQDASTLKIASVRLDHAGNYTCLAKNRAGTQAHTAQLVVHGEPRWLKEPQTEPMVAVRGQTVVIDCLTTGWPQPKQSWMFKTHMQGEFEPLPLSPPLGRITLAANGSLIIKKADKLDEANYLCISSNGIGKGLSWSTSLKVTVPAHFEYPAKQQQQKIVRKLSPVQLRCDAFGDTPITIDWLKTTQLAKVPLHQDSEPRYTMKSSQMPLKNGLISLLTITQTLREDNLVFECVTKNPYGRDRTAIELIVQEEPDAIQDIQLVGPKSSRSVTLMWSEPYDGRSSITSYLFQYKKLHESPVIVAVAGHHQQAVSDGSPLLDYLDSNSFQQPAAERPTSLTAAAAVDDDDWQQAARIMLPVVQAASNSGSNSTSAMRSITIEKLEPSSRYLVRALAINSIGQSKFSQPMEFATEEEAPDIGPVNIRAQALNSTSIQVSWDEIPKSRQLSRIQGYYIGYRVATNNSAASNFIYKPYIISPSAAAATINEQQSATSGSSSSSSSSAQQRLETFVTELRRDTVYEITVVAFNSRGSGPASDFVVCKTIEMEAPKPVKLQIRRESNESIFIEWQRDPSDQNPIDDFVLYQEKNSASQEWLQVRLPGNQTQYRAPGLKCGTRYQFYIIAHNKVGKSVPSDVISASTSGALPVIPTKTQLMKMINSTCLMVNLNAFQDNGCRIKTFTVRYRLDKMHAPPAATSQASQSSSGGGRLETPTSATSTLVNSNGLSATHQALSATTGPAATNNKGGVLPVGSGTTSSLGMAAAAPAQASSSLSSSSSSATGQLLTSEWVTIRPKSNGKHQRGANEEDRIEYLCDLSSVGEYTVHVAAANDVGRSEADYSVLMSSDELRRSFLRDAFDLMSGLPNVFAFIPFLGAGLVMSLLSLKMYTTAIKYWQKFEIMRNQWRATRRAKADQKRRQKLAGGGGNQNGKGKGAMSQSSKQLDYWADEYEEELEDDQVESNGLDEDGDDEGSSGCSSGGSRAPVVMHSHGNRRHHQQAHLHSHHHHLQQQQQQQQHHHQHHHHHRQFSNSLAGHYLSNIANSAFDTSSIDTSPCNKFGGRGGAASGSTCLSTASTDSIHGRFQCLNAKQYVKMNEYTMLPSQPLGMSPTAASNDVYGTASIAAQANPLQQQQQQQQPTAGSNGGNSPINSIYYSTLRRTTNMQTYLPQQMRQQQQQQQQRQQINRRHSQNVADYYGYYMGPNQAQAAVAAQQAADEAANSIFVPPQQIIYSAPNIRRQPPPGTFI